MKTLQLFLRRWPIIVLAFAATSARATIEFSFQATSIHTSSNDFWAGGYIYFGSPVLNVDSNSMPITYHYVAGPNTNHHAHVSSNGGGSGSGFHLSLSNMLDGVTNGQWKLILNVGHPSATTNFFTLSATGVTSNTFAPVLVFSPVDGATNQPAIPNYHWNGPSNTAQVHVEVHSLNFSYFISDILPPAATNWPAAPPVAGGTNLFKVRYHTNADAFWTFTAPTNQVTGTPVAGWTSTSTNASQQETLFSVGSHGTTPETNLLWAHLKFDNSGNLLLDSSGLGHNGAGVGWFGGGGPPVFTATGVTNGGIVFDGNNYLYFGTNVTRALDDDFSVSVWVKTTQTSNNDDTDARYTAGIFSAQQAFDNVEDSIPMALTGSKLGFHTGSPAQTAHSADSINTGSFVHLAVTRERASGLKKLYVNGVLSGSGYGSVNSLIDNIDLSLGINQYSAQGVIGTLDDLQVYKGVLSASQVEFLHDNPGMTAPVNITLAQALDTTNLVWTTGGDAIWFGQSAVHHDGVDAARTGFITNNQTTWLQTIIPGPGTVSFWWRVSDDGNSSEMDFYIDGGDQDYLAGDAGWQPSPTFVITNPGPHTLYWEYYKYDTNIAGLNAAFVDELTFTPAVVPGAPVISNQPMSCVTLTGTAAGFLVTAGGNPNYQWRFNNNPIAGATNHFLIRTNAAASNEGNYTVVLTNAGGSVTSAVATLTVTNLAEVPPFVFAVGPFQIGASASTGQQLATDGSNHLYLAGEFTGTQAFGVTNLTATGPANLFLAKADGNGNILWAQRVGGSNTFANALTVTPDGHVLVGGSFRGTGDFGPFTLTNAGSFDGFVARFDAQGNCDFAQRWGGTSGDYVEGVDADTNGNIYAAGVFITAATVGPSNLTGIGGPNGLLTRFGTNGALHWTLTPGVSSLSSDVKFQSNALYWCGTRFAAMTLGGTNALGTNGGRMFLAKLDTNANCTWLRTAGSDDPALYSFVDFQSLAKFNGGGVYMGGRVMGAGATFGTNVLASGSNVNTFLSRWNPDGHVQFARLVGNTNTYGPALTADTGAGAEGAAFIAGTFGGPTDFGGICLFNGRGPGYNPADRGLFVAGYDLNGNLLGVRGLEATNNAGAEYFSSGVAVELDGQVYLGGTVSNGVLFGTNFFAASNGVTRAVVTKVDSGPGPLQWQATSNTAGNFEFNFQSQAGRTHLVEYRDDLQTGSWLPHTNLTGNGSVLAIVQPAGALPKRFFRVRTF